MVNGMRQRLIFFVPKEPDYNIIMIYTCSILTVTDGQKEGIIILHGVAIKFKYPAIFLIITDTGR